MNSLKSILILSFFVLSGFVSAQTIETRQAYYSTNSSNNCSKYTDDRDCRDGALPFTYAGGKGAHYWVASCEVGQFVQMSHLEDIWPEHPSADKYNGKKWIYKCVSDPVLAPDNPSECAEIGQFFDGAKEECVPECPSGSLDDICLEALDEENQCDESSEDFRGNVNQGFGHPPLAICGETTCTTGGRPGQSGIMNNELVCLPDDYGAPKCKGGSITVIEEYGFICATVGDEEETDTSDGDSDEDGEGDLTGIAGQLQDIKKLLGNGNQGTDNIVEALKGMGNKLTSAIGDIPGGGGGGSNGNGDGEGEGEGGVSWSGDAIDTELTDPTDDYDQVMADYQTKINEIKAEVQAMFSTNLSGGGSVDDDIKSIKGVEVNFSLNRFLSGLDILGAIVLFCAAFISAGILFTSRG